MSWVSDDELLLLIERRPAAERHVLALRYLAGLGFAQISDVMGLARREAMETHREALRALEHTLSSVTRSPRVAGHHPMARLGHQTPVLHRRRRALLAA